jgi:hypothetical protein
MFYNLKPVLLTKKFYYFHFFLQLFVSKLGTTTIINNNK